RTAAGPRRGDRETVQPYGAPLALRRQPGGRLVRPPGPVTIRNVCASGANPDAGVADFLARSRVVRCSVEQAVEFTAQAGGGGGFGGVAGGGAQALLGGAPRGGALGGAAFPEGFPGRRLDLGLEEFQGPPHQVFAILRLVHGPGVLAP